MLFTSVPFAKLPAAVPPLSGLPGAAATVAYAAQTSDGADLNIDLNYADDDGIGSAEDARCARRRAGGPDNPKTR